jgi:hypothetical protein
MSHEHKTAALTSRTQPDGTVRWACNACGRWTTADNCYYGEWECSQCDWKEIEWVACSKACMVRLTAPRPGSASTSSS